MAAKYGQSCVDGVERCDYFLERFAMTLPWLLSYMFEYLLLVRTGFILNILDYFYVSPGWSLRNMLSRLRVIVVTEDSNSPPHLYFTIFILHLFNNSLLEHMFTYHEFRGTQLYSNKLALDG